MNTWKPIAAALVIFAAGVVTGGITVKLRNPTQPSPQRPFNRLRTERPAENAPAQRPWNTLAAEGQLRDLAQRVGRVLELAPAQRERIQSILAESQTRMKALAEEYGPRTREEFRHMRERIRQELTPDQRRKFEELFRNRDARLRRPEASAPPAQTPHPTPD